MANNVHSKLCDYGRKHQKEYAWQLSLAFISSQAGKEFATLAFSSKLIVSSFNLQV
jgi:hypothetical protein